MAKAKYEKWLEFENLILIASWARDGLSDKQIAHNMDVSLSTLKVWKKKYVSISAALKKGKEIVDVEVENALHKRAMGYDYPEITEERIINKETKETELVVTKVVTKHQAGDVTAQIIWLKNRKPDVWRDKASEYQIELLKLERARIELETKRVELQEKSSLYGSEEGSGGGVIEIAAVMEIPEEFGEIMEAEVGKDE